MKQCFIYYEVYICQIIIFGIVDCCDYYEFTLIQSYIYYRVIFEDSLGLCLLEYLYSYRFYINQKVFIIVKNNSAHFIYYEVYIYISESCIMLLLDWFIKLKRSIINVLLQIVCFQEVLNVSYMEYFMNYSIFC